MRVVPTVQLGVEWNPAAEEVGPIATWFLSTETDRRPAVFVGTSSDRIGSPPHTQSYYLTIAKSFVTVPVAPYATLNWSEWDEALNIPFGMQVRLGSNLSVQPMYDGHRSHILGTWSNRRVSATLIWAWFETLGFAGSVGF